MDSGMLLKTGVAIERGLPFIFSNYSMAGAPPRRSLLPERWRCCWPNCWPG